MGIFAKGKINKEEKKEMAANEPEKKAIAKRNADLASSRRKSLVKHVWITEKSSGMSNSGKYIFVVENSANKSEIKRAIEAIYSVGVTGVNMINSKGKSKRLGRSMGRTSAYKKAIITLKEGQKIDVIPT